MSGISRRSFLKGGALFASAAAAGAALSGCAPDGGGSQDAKESLSQTGGSVGADLNVSVKETDVVIVGGGIAGMTAARLAMENGSSVAIIDKGEFGHSGASGINWGHQLSSLEYCTEEEINAFGPMLLFGGDGVLDQKIWMPIMHAWAAVKPLQTAIAVGSVTERHKDGKSAGQVNRDNPEKTNPLTNDAGMFPRNFARQLRRAGAAVYELHYALDILKDANGEACGVAAINLKTGDPVVFRGKSVIMATGSYVYLCGWNGMTPYTHSSADCTGDGTAMMLRAGIPMRDMEELCQDNGQWYPAATRQCMTGMGVELPDYYRGFNVNKESFTSLIDENPGQYMNQGCYMRMTLREIYQGRGTEHGGIYALTDDLENEERYYRPAKWNMERVFDYELPQYTELVPQAWETAGRPFDLDPETCETVVPGVYYAGGAPTVWNGFVVSACMATGYMSGIGAAKRAKDIDLGEVDWNQVNDIYAQAYSYFDNDSATGERSRKVWRNIQDAFWDGMYFLRNEEGIQGTIDNLKKIEADDIPSMYLGDPTPNFNKDWRHALEARNMVTVGIGAAESALLRKECRGTHCRTDYPFQDDENGLFNTKVAFDGQNWTSETVPIDETLVPADTLRQNLGNVGLED